MGGGSGSSGGGSGRNLWAPSMVDVGYGTLNLTTGQVSSYNQRTYGITLQAFHEQREAQRKVAENTEIYAPDVINAIMTDPANIQALLAHPSRVYNGVSGTDIDIGFTDGSVGINLKFVPFETNDEPWPTRTWQVLHSAFDSFAWDWAMETEQSANHYKQTSVIIIYNDNRKDIGTAEYGKVLWLIRKTREFSMGGGGSSKPKEIPYDPSDQMKDFIETSIEYHKGRVAPTVWDIYFNYIFSFPKEKRKDTGNGVDR